MQDMVKGLQHIAQEGKIPTEHGPTTVMAELKAAALIQRKLFICMLATQDSGQEASVRSAVLHTTAQNLQQPWPLVLETHEEILVSCLIIVWSDLLQFY